MTKLKHTSCSKMSVEDLAGISWRRKACGRAFSASFRPQSPSFTLATRLRPAGLAANPLPRMISPSGETVDHKYHSATLSMGSLPFIHEQRLAGCLDSTYPLNQPSSFILHALLHPTTRQKWNVKDSAMIVVFGGNEVEDSGGCLSPSTIKPDLDGWFHGVFGVENAQWSGVDV